jgi:hypothetical protein
MKYGDIKFQPPLPQALHSALESLSEGRILREYRSGIETALFLILIEYLALHGKHE